MEFRQHIGTRKNYRVTVHDAVGEVPSQKPSWHIAAHLNADDTPASHHLATMVTSADGATATIQAEAPGKIKVAVSAT